MLLRAIFLASQKLELTRISRCYEWENFKVALKQAMHRNLFTYIVGVVYLLLFSSSMENVGACF